MPKKDTRGGRRNEAAAANGRTVGRPTTITDGTRHTVTLDADTLAVLLSINPKSLSLAIQALARQSHD